MKPIRLIAAAALFVLSIMPSFALDGEYVPGTHPLRYAVVTIHGNGNCTGVALTGGVILTAAHCVLNLGESPNYADHSGWPRQVIDFQIIYYSVGHKDLRVAEQVSILIEDTRDLALIKVKGGHPPNAVTFAAPIGPEYEKQFKLGNKPQVVVAGRGGHSEGALQFDPADINFVYGEASGNTFSPAGFFVSVPLVARGACEGDSGSPIFLSATSGLSSDITQLTLVGILTNIWRGGSYGPPRRKCSQEMIANALTSRPSGLDSNAWLASELTAWGVRASSAAGVQQ